MKKPNLLEEMGLVGPVIKLSKDDRKRYIAEYRRRNADRINALVREKKRGPRREKILAQKRAWYAANKQKCAAYQNQYRSISENKEKILKRQAAYRARAKVENRDAYLQAKRDHYTNNKERYRELHRRWREANPDWSKIYQSINREHRREYSRGYQKKRMQNPSNRTAASMRSRVWALIKKIGAKKEYRVGLEADKLRGWLEAKFQPGMTWDNYGTVWVVDHIIPCAAWDLSKEREVKLCFHYHNLQPLWKRENAQKSDKVPTQTELQLVA